MHQDCSLGFASDCNAFDCNSFVDLDEKSIDLLPDLKQEFIDVKNEFLEKTGGYFKGFLNYERSGCSFIYNKSMEIDNSFSLIQTFLSKGKITSFYVSFNEIEACLRCHCNFPIPGIVEEIFKSIPYYSKKKHLWCDREMTTKEFLVALIEKYNALNNALKCEDKDRCNWDELLRDLQQRYYFAYHLHDILFNLIGQNCSLFVENVNVTPYRLHDTVFESRSVASQQWGISVTLNKNSCLEQSKAIINAIWLIVFEAYDRLDNQKKNEWNDPINIVEIKILISKVNTFVSLNFLKEFCKSNVLSRNIERRMNLDFMKKISLILDAQGLINIGDFINSTINSLPCVIKKMSKISFLNFKQSGQDGMLNYYNQWDSSSILFDTVSYYYERKDSSIVSIALSEKSPLDRHRISIYHYEDEEAFLHEIGNILSPLENKIYLEIHKSGLNLC
jgi:hypothetical protein